MKLQRKYILQYLCILVLAAIGVMNIIEADYLRALTSAIYVFVCVQVVVAGYRFADLTALGLNYNSTVSKMKEDAASGIDTEKDGLTKLLVEARDSMNEVPDMDD